MVRMGRAGAVAAASARLSTSRGVLVVLCDRLSLFPGFALVAALFDRVRRSSRARLLRPLRLPRALFLRLRLVRLVS